MMQLVPTPPAKADHFFGRVVRLVQEKEYNGTEPATCADGSIEILAENIDWLEHHIDTYGSIVAKQPDIWGEARLTKHRDEYEKILFQELNQFEFKLNAAIRQSDQSFATAAIALSDAAATTTSTTSRTPAQRFRRDAVTTVTESQTVTPIIINPTDLKATLPASPAPEFTAAHDLSRFDGGNKINIEPTVYLDQLSRYVQHLNELRRINEGDDTSDSPGYAMNLVRIPVSLLPGKLTREGFGAEITVTATPVVTDDLLPTTYRNLVINDLVSQLGLTIVKFVEIRAWERIAESKNRWAEIQRLNKEIEGKEKQVTELRSKLQKLEEEFAEADKKRSDARQRQESAQITFKAIDDQLSGKDEASVDHLTAALGDLKASNPDIYEKTVNRFIPSDFQDFQGGVSPQILADSLQTKNLDEAAKTKQLGLLKGWQEQLQSSASQAAQEELETEKTITRLNSEIPSVKRQITLLVGGNLHSTADPPIDDASITRGQINELENQITSLKNKIDVDTRALEAVGATTQLNSARNRGSQQPLPPTQLVDIYGRECLAAIAHDFYISYRGRDVRWAGYQECKIDGKSVECRVNLIDVRLWLQAELGAAFDLLCQPEPLNLWVEFAHPSRGLASEIRQNFVPDPSIHGVFALGTVPHAREQFLTRLTSLNPAIANNSVCCARTLECLAWAITVESTLLNQRLNEDLRKVAVAKQCSCMPNQASDYLFFLPDAAAKPESSFNGDFALATQAFQEYVRCRWPIHVFAIDPANQDQNVADFSSRRRELQLALSMGFTQGAVSARTLMQYSRQLETEVETLSLNQTIVGFGHGADTFGWRFYPRVQALDQPGAAGTVWQSFRGTPRDHDVRKRQLEPGMRECVAVVLMPSFVPYADFDIRSNWFRLTNPKNAALTMKETMRLSRAVTAMRHSRAQCAKCAQCYREGEVERLMKRVDQLDRELPLQTMRQQIPFENTLGGFQMFSTGVTDFAPELYGWYGAPGVIVGGNYQCGCYADCQYCKTGDPNCKRVSFDGAAVLQTTDITKKALPIPLCEGEGTTLFLVGDHLSVHDTKIIAGGVCIPDVRLVSREIMRVTIPGCVNTVEVAGEKYVAVYAATPYGVTNHLHIPVVNLPKSEEEKAIAKKIEGVEQQLATLSEGVPVLTTKEKLAFDANCAVLGQSSLTLVPKFGPEVKLQLSPAAYGDDVEKYTFAVSYRGIISSVSDAEMVENPTPDGLFFRFILNDATVDKITAELQNRTTFPITTTSFDSGGKDVASIHLYANKTGNLQVPIAGVIPIELTLACNCCETAKSESQPAPTSGLLPTQGEAIPPGSSSPDCDCTTRSSSSLILTR